MTNPTELSTTQEATRCARVRNCVRDFPNTVTKGKTRIFKTMGKQ